MFIINGVDYTFHVFGILFVAASAAIFFTAQYMLCSKAKKISTRLIPAYGVLLLVVLAIIVTTGGTGGSPIDLRGAVALMILGFASICGLSAGAAWVIYRVRSKK